MKKKISMRKVALGAGYFRYEVVENDQVIAKRVSHREYIAAFVVKPYYKCETPFMISKMFGRADLLAKAMSKTLSTDLYAVAELTQ